jgi:uncharacterized protein (DUF58 family)
MAGWLYVISGISLALLAIAAILPERMLRDIAVHRPSIHPVSAGDQLTIELVLENRSHRPKVLLQVRDLMPRSLGKPSTVAIEAIAPHSRYSWLYYQPTQQRGIYRWQTMELRTAAPLGLFWCRRSRIANATAIVYPTVLPLARCPLVDEIGQDTSLQFTSDRRAQAATEGLTQSLRPYRWGDPMRLIHWRSSARYGELRVRELELFTGGQELIICLDSAMPWQSAKGSAIARSETFEQAVIAAASLYFYACHRRISVKLWTAGTGLLQGSQVVLEALAAVRSGEGIYTETLSNRPLVWLTQNPASLSTLPAGSRWILWSSTQADDQQAGMQIISRDLARPGIVMDPSDSLQQRLQAELSPI